MMKSGSMEYMGNSDSGILFYIDKLLNDIKPKIVVIERDLNEVEDSLRKCFTDEMVNKIQSIIQIAMGKEIERIRNTYEHLAIKFEEINMENARKIWEYCLPTILFSEERFKIFNRARVEPCWIGGR